MIKTREECIAKLEKNVPDFWVCDGTMEDIMALEKEYNYDYNKVYEEMKLLVEIMYEED